MKKNVVLSGVIGLVLIFGNLVCYAEKWDKNEYSDSKIESGYYGANSIKVKGKLVSWTEKYNYTSEGATYTNTELSKHPACKAGIAKNGKVTQYQLDYEIDNGKKFRGVAKRYYNKAGQLVCTNKDTGNEFKSDWNVITRGSPMQQAQYDLLTKYKVTFE
jgi:hypothetical protein